MALQVLLWLCGVVLALVVLVAVLPVHIALSWQSDPVRRTTVVLRPFGGVSPPMRVFDSIRKPRPAAERTARKTGKSPRSPRNVRGRILSDAVTLLRRVLGAIHFDRLHLDAEFGLGDPAETGQLFGQLCPLIYGAGADVRLRPNFDQLCFHGNALAQLRVTPIAVVWPFVGFFWRVFGPRR